MPVYDSLWVALKSNKKIIRFFIPAAVILLSSILVFGSHFSPALYYDDWGSSRLTFIKEIFPGLFPGLSGR
jgi:hypothetical protein